MTIKALKEVMTRCVQNEDTDTYEELWEAVRTLTNLGLLEDKYNKAMVDMDRKFSELT